MKTKIKEQITCENLLCFLIILCPIFDNVSYAFRHYYNSELSIVTIARPIIPVIISIYMFIKVEKKDKFKLLAIAFIYFLYGAAHLLVTKNLFTGSSYGTIRNEAQYIINFTFSIVLLIIYLYTFVKNNSNLKSEKIEKSITIMLLLYVLLLYISVITKISPYTYPETKVGFKGLNESGNSISAICILSLFIVLPSIGFTTLFKSEKKERIFKIIGIITYLLVSIYMITLIGTRAGLFGILLVTALYVTFEILFRKNKKMIIALILFALLAGVLVLTVGSSTISRRKQISEAKNLMIDKSTGQVGNMTIDMLDLKNNILNGNVTEDYLPKANQQAVLDLHEYTKMHNTPGNDLRTLQLMYNIFLVKNQRNALTILFGNGYKANLGEMVMENELASIPLNFGIIGFILYLVPFIAIFIISIKKGIQNKKNLTIKYVMLQSALLLSFILSWMSGYVFFPISSMILVVTICTLLIIEMKKIERT